MTNLKTCQDFYYLNQIDIQRTVAKLPYRQGIVRSEKKGIDDYLDDRKLYQDKLLLEQRN